MNDNKYIEKFQSKTDAELANILENKETPKLEAIENEIQTTKKRKVVAQRKIIEEEKKKNNITDDPTAPELHSKRVIMVFSGLFSTIFGAVLLMYNIKQMNNPKGRIQVLIFGILYTIATLVLINLLNSKSNIVIIINIVGGMILTEYFWNQFIGKEFKHRKRSWIKPAIISILITIPLLLAVIYGQ
ncbi:hypothetical protein [Kordia sp.]|uniref:hypothetical protein n=1 Tax=Kordia sp. TaxID=1965332 RepID=UPI003D26721F